MCKIHFILALAFIMSPITYAAGGHGLTWAKQSHDSNFGIDRVACQLAGSSPANCNAYVGDTSCQLSRLSYA